MVALDGAYVADTEPPVFRRIAPPREAELQALVERLAERVGRSLERQGLLVRDTENDFLEFGPAAGGAMDDLIGHSITYRVAVGPRAGQKVFALQTLPARHPGSRRRTPVHCPALDSASTKRPFIRTIRYMTRRLLEASKKALRPLPQTVPIALHAPQQAVEVRLTIAGSTINVTHSCVVASLAPFRVAVGLSGALQQGSETGVAELGFRDTSSGETIGRLALRPSTRWQLDTGTTFAIFDVTDGTHRCVIWPYRVWNRWLQDRSYLRKPQGALQMTAEGVQHTMIFYMCPRPVVLVSVSGPQHDNLFPMDLIGPISEDRFSLALRSTSPSIPTMKTTRRVVLSDMPAALTPTIYQLGEHHKKANVDWSALPFEMRNSSIFSMPYPAIALRARELEILKFDEVGSHTLFITRVASETRHAQGAQLFHVNGSYQYYRTKLAEPFALAG